MSALMDYLMERQDDILLTLRKLVEIESPSSEKNAVDQFVRFLRSLFSNITESIEIIENSQNGNHLRIEWGEGEQQILILCHMDTVWPLGEITRRPFHIKNGKAFGPGIFDMKGGIAQTYWALEALNRLESKHKKRVVVLFNSDEEIGSSSSRELIESESKKSSFVLVPEPAAGPEGAVKIWRKGWGFYELKVTGIPAHAGNDHQNGVNAIEELAHQILRIQKLTDYNKETTVNVGVVSGGSCFNVVAAEATAKIDLRFRTKEEGERIEKELMHLKSVLPGSSLILTGGINRPPLEQTPQNQLLYLTAKRIAKEFNFNLPAVGVGGVSDGNFTSALGIPTLDGIGLLGDGSHAFHEHVVIDAIVPRIALLAGLIESL